MKRTVCLYVVILFYLNINGQTQPYNYNYEITYKLTWQPDSTDKMITKTEFVSLFTGANQSVFASNKYLLMDSAIQAENMKGNKFGPSFSFFEANGTREHYVGFKTSDKIISYDAPPRFSNDLYKYEESRDLMKWKILKDTLTIGGQQCQKAETIFGGRKWLAWFAPSIPIPDGPYKFNGLPGLIMKISDLQNFWNFEFASLKNYNKQLEVFFLNKIYKVATKEEYFKQKKYVRDNRFELMNVKGWKFSNPAASKKQFETEAKRDNNWIEIY